MPRAKWMSDSEYRAFESCLKKVKDKNVNKYAVCAASIKKSRGTKKEAMKNIRKKK